MKLRTTHLHRSLKIIFSLICAASSATLYAQAKLPILKTTKKQLIIQDGEHVTLHWELDRRARPDKYYVHIPHRNNKITFKSDQGKLSFKTRDGQHYDFVVLMNEKDSFFIRIVSKDEPTSIALQLQQPLPDTIPFTLVQSRISLQGLLNGKEQVNIQFDMGAGGSCVNKMASEKLNLSFSEKAMLSNTQGINEVRKSANNKLTIGNMNFTGISIVESGNMQPGEDIIIGNFLFRDKIIEIDYDKKVLIIGNQLPAYAKSYKKLPVFYEQHRPKFKASVTHNGKRYPFWFFFDTGSKGTLKLGEDFTEQGENWKNLQELTILNDRKVVRLNATIAGVEFKDVVANASDPTKPVARRTLTLFGNQLLNHFNAIIDNLNGYIYLKPNSRINEPYANYQSYLEEMKTQKQ